MGESAAPEVVVETPEAPEAPETVVEATEPVEAVVEDDAGGTKIAPEPPKEQEPEDGPLTQENYKERLKKLRGETKVIPPEAKKDPLPGDPPPVTEPKKALDVTTKEPVKVVEPGKVVEPVVVEEWKAKEKYTFKSLGKDYELPKFATSGLTNAEDEKALTETYEKALGLDHVKQRHQELHTSHQELQTSHKKITDGMADLKEIYAASISTQNPLLLDDFFAKLNIPANVVLQYAMARVEYEQAEPAQKQALDNQLAANRQIRDTSKQTASLTSRAESSESRALELELNSSLARPEVTLMQQTYDSQPGRKPGDFRVRVAEHGEYIYLKSGGKTVLAPEEVIKQVVSMYGLGTVPPVVAPQGDVVEPVVDPVVPTVAPVTAAAPVVIPAGQKPIAILPATPAGGVVSPAKKGITTIAQQRDALKNLTA